MGASSYPGMTQPFSMTHGSNMGAVGVRQDSMGKCFFFFAQCFFFFTLAHDPPLTLPYLHPISQPENA